MTRYPWDDGQLFNVMCVKMTQQCQGKRTEKSQKHNHRKLWKNEDEGAWCGCCTMRLVQGERGV